MENKFDLIFDKVEESHEENAAYNKITLNFTVKPKGLNQSVYIAVVLKRYKIPPNSYYRAFGCETKEGFDIYKSRWMNIKTTKKYRKGQEKELVQEIKEYVSKSVSNYICLIDGS